MSEIQDIKERLVLSEIIGQRVKLTPAGTYMKGLCPFHHEKSPSFHVNDQLGFYKCFGCGEGGDAFTFLEKYEGMTFREALEYLAGLTGVTLTNRQQTPEDKLRARVLAVLEADGEFYQKNLDQPVGKPARDYLQTRGTSQFLIKLFGLGAAPNDWQALCNYLHAQKFSDKEIVASGMARQKDTGRIYDTFRGRLMFPLRNHRGQIVGFSGRQLVANPDEGKYINTPETLVYHKGKMLYGLHEHAGQIRKNKMMLIVEGEFDMLSSSQAGVDWVCAIKGSALTEDHASLIARYTDKVLLALDSDGAGINATKKAIKVLRPHGVDLRVVMVAGGKDPDELARADAAAWREQVKKAVSVYEFFIQVITTSNNIRTIDGQKQALQQLGQVFPLIDNRLEYEFYLKKVADILGQDLEIVRADIKQWGQMSAEKNLPAVTGVPAIHAQSKAKPTKRRRLENYVWFLFLQLLGAAKNVAQASDFIRQTHWETPALQKLSQYWEIFYRQKPQATLKDFHQSLPEDFQQKMALLSLNQTFLKFLQKTDLWQEWQKQTAALEQLIATQEIDELTRELATLEKIDDPTLEQEKQKNELLQKIVTLKKQGN